MLEHWNILVGRQPLQNIGLRTEDGWDISGEDVQIWLEEQGENSFAISAYCEKLLPMLREAEGRAWWMLTTLTDQVPVSYTHLDTLSPEERTEYRTLFPEPVTWKGWWDDEDSSEVLESVREEGQDKAEWNLRMAYGHQYLYGQGEKAIPYAQRWAELDLSLIHI